MVKAEFDHYSESYTQLLHDPIRECFSPGGVEFFHARKRDMILQYFKKTRKDLKSLSYLDFGCGKGELLSLLQGAFASSAGCDPSEGMLRAANLESKGMDIRVQDDFGKVPFDSQMFDFVTAVCVFHHVPPPERPALLREMYRVIKPGGTLAIIEHNPYNPVTQLIVSRTPVDADAILLRPKEVRSLFSETGFSVDDQKHFLYLPQKLYESMSWIESALETVPMGGQYVVFGRK